MKCPKCDFENPEDSKFCKECGSKIIDIDEARPSFTKTMEAPARGFALGSLFADRYKIQEELGRGGMGTVYMAKDKTLKRTVALKFLPQELTRDQKAKERFFLEAQAAAALDHTNICTVFEVGEKNDQTYIVMSYISGESLKDKILKKSLDIDKVTDIALQTAEGLQDAHDKGIIHRDIKPANIMLTEKGKVKIVDFGLVKLAGEAELTRTGTTLGTVAYMSPEQAQGEKVDHRADIWSLGVVLYEMLTQELPFKGEAAQAAIFSILNKDLELPSSIRPDIPPHLDQIVLRSLQKDKKQRYQSIKEFLQDLRQPPPLTFSKPEKSIVVLPLENMSPDKENEYFSDGLTEEIIADLSQIKDLRVISRTSAMMLKGTKKSVKTLARELNVGYILEGSVRKSGNNLRITAQLIDAKIDTHLWAKKYSGTIDDVFDIQEKVSRSIVEELKLKLSPEEDQKIAQRPIEDIRVYETYLRARRAMWTFSEEAMDRAEESLREAIDKIGDNELLLATLGYIYVMYINTGLKPDQYVYNLQQAREYAKKTFELNPLSSSGHSLIGVAYFFEGKIQEAVRHLKESLQQNPNNPDALLFLSYAYLISGKGFAARPLINKAMEIDPLMPLFQCMPGFLDIMEGRFESAIPYYRKMLEMDPDNQTAQLFYAWVLSFSGLKDEACLIIDLLVKLDPHTPAAHMGNFLKYVLMNDKEKALKSVTPELLAAGNAVEFFARFLFDGYALIDEKEEAMDWIENDMNLGFINYPFLLDYNPHLKSVRSEKRFKQIMEKVKHRWENFEI